MQKTSDFVIPARPEILLKLSAEIRKDDPNFNTIAQIMKMDLSLYANVLATINTPFFGMPERITSMARAVSLLGINRLYSIVRMAALRNSLSTLGRMDRFWDSATEVGTICGHLSRHLRFLNKDDAYTMGMMHDCGVPLMMTNCKGYKSFFNSRNGADLPLIHRQEHEIYGMDHFKLSAAIAQVWGIPELICDVIGLQPYILKILEDESYSEELRNVLCLLLLSRELSDKFRSLWSVDDIHRPVVPVEPMLEYLGLSESDFLDIRDEVFSHIEVGDQGIVPS
ncbi:MAG: HDOD domain-containing protein [Marinobacterium sp.]|nr:HDOD domain-containing protein [Marinobacterium sp.]